ncbi:hypothetical protein [Cellulomonas persica]|nr:hypothetical protein [Cellulomonas persica]
MTRHVRVAPAVDTALAAAGYRPYALGDDGALVAVALDGSQDRVELHVLRADDTTRARVGALRAVRHDHLARVLEAVPLSADELGVFTEHVTGTRLDALLAAREPLTDGEAATLAIPVAQALEALHAAGVQHGGVGPGAIVVGPDGRPVLAGLGVALRHVPAAADESGADVRALLDAVLGPQHAVEPGSLAEALDELRREACPGAARVVDRCFRVAVPVPLRLPDAADLAARAGRDAVTSLRQGGVRDSGRRRAGHAARSGRARGRSAGSPLPRGLVVGACAVVLAAGVTGTVLVAPWRMTTDGASAAAATHRPFASPSSGPAAAGHARTDPRDAAVMLTQRRAVLLGQGRGAPLHEVELTGSPAHTADSQLVAQLGDDRVSGLEVTVTAVEPLEASRDDEARVRVTSTTSAYERVAPDGTTRPGGPAATSTVVLVLRWTDQGWRVWDVAAA